MTMPGRGFQAGKYRFGFNGQEKSDEIFEGSTTALFWEYDSRTGRRWNVDPKPTVGQSEYATLGNNPILYIDPLGDVTKGINEKSANGAKKGLDDIIGGIKNGDKLKSHFTLDKDKVTFNKVDKDKFSQDVKNLKLSAEQAALLNGYVDAINDEHFTHYIGILEATEPIDLKTANLSNEFQGINGKTMTQLGVDGKSFTGDLGKSNINTLSLINSNPQNDYTNYADPPDKNFVPPVSFIITHELVGHLRGEVAFKNNWFLKGNNSEPSPLSVKKASNLHSVQVNNVYFRAMGIKKEDTGSFHNRVEKINAPPGPPMDATERNKIPDDLK